MNDICIGAAYVNQEEERLLIKGIQKLSILKLTENNWHAKTMDIANTHHPMQEQSKTKQKQVKKARNVKGELAF